MSLEDRSTLELAVLAAIGYVVLAIAWLWYRADRAWHGLKG